MLGKKMSNTHKPLILVIDFHEKKEVFWKNLLKEFNIFIASDYKMGVDYFEGHFFKIRSVLMLFDASPACIKAFKSIKEINGQMHIIAFSREKNLKTAITALRLSAFEFLHLPDSKKLIPKLILKSIQTSYDYATHVLKDLNEPVFDTKKILWDFYKKQEIHFQNFFQAKQVSKEDVKAIFSVKEVTDLSVRYQEFEDNISVVGGGLNNLGIILFDDIPEYRDQIKGIVSLHYPFFFAQSFEDVQSILEKHSNIKLCIINLLSEEQLTYNVLSVIKQSYPNLSVIAAAPLDYFRTVLTAFQDGASDYIEVPYIESEVLQIIQNDMVASFKENVLPVFRQFMLAFFLQKQEKIDLLNKIKAYKEKKGFLLSMNDFYMLFPYLRESFIPEEVVIPKKVLKRGVEEFMKKIEAQLDFVKKTAQSS